MNNNGWLDIALCPTTEAAGGDRFIIVWHIFQGVMVSSILRARENRFNVYWQEIPDYWIDPADRMPTSADSDVLNCVLAKDQYGHMRMKGWHQIVQNGDTKGWQPCPDPPGNASELRRNAV